MANNQFYPVADDFDDYVAANDNTPLHDNDEDYLCPDCAFWSDVFDTYLDVCDYVGKDYNPNVIGLIDDRTLPLDEAFRLMGMGYIIDAHPDYSF